MKGNNQLHSFKKRNILGKPEMTREYVIDIHLNMSVILILHSLCTIEICPSKLAANKLKQSHTALIILFDSVQCIDNQSDIKKKSKQYLSKT